jgi:hypothetical protein
MNRKIKSLLKTLYNNKKLTLIIIAVILIVIIIINVISCSRKNAIRIGADDRIDITPEQIRSVEAIGQWEFLSVSDEEFVDTVRKGFFSDDKLARIYVGTLRLGVDMQRVQKDWLKVDADTLVAILPKIQLLDKRFMDEARTRSFFESGSWSAVDREALYQRAYRLMMERCMTVENIKSAEENARIQFTALFHSMGYSSLRITFSNQ